MTEYYVFMRREFNELSCIGTALELQNGCINLRLKAIPLSGDIMLSPVHPKCPVQPLTLVRSK